MPESRLRAIVVAAAVLALGGAAAPAASPARGAPAPKLTFRVLSHTPQKMDSILWTGTRFLEVENTANTIWSAPASGAPIQQFASMPKLVEETRCILSPGAYGFARGAIFCHSPDNKIYEISPDGKNVRVLATLPAPYPPAADGALAFDDVGRFGHGLVAATGRSGGGEPAGGAVYTIDASGDVQEVGTYSGPGADELAIAPAGFGSAGGDALLALDGGKGDGSLVAVDPAGGERTVAKLSDGPNPIAFIPRTSRTRVSPEPGLYVTDDINGYVYVAPAAELEPYAGDLVVGSETEARFWIVSPQGSGFRAVRVRHNLRGGDYSLEGATFVP